MKIQAKERELHEAAHSGKERLRRFCGLPISEGSFMKTTAMSSPAWLRKNVNCMGLNFTKSLSNRRSARELLGGEGEVEDWNQVGGLVGGPGEVPCRPLRAHWLASRSLYILRISEDPLRGLVYMGYVATDIYLIRNQNWGIKK